IGPNGGGKTSLLQTLLGVLHPYEGTIHVLGREPAHLDKARGQIGYVAQTKQFDRDFPARAKDVVLMGTFPQIGIGRLPGSKEKARVFEALEQVGMQDRASRPIGRLSGGEQQRVFIAQALVSHPRLLILDEPTAGVDREGEESLIRLLTRLKTESDLTILMVSHNVSLIRSHTDRIVCLNRELIFAGPASGLTDAVIAEAYHPHPAEAPGV
ncbi:MAG TPA: ABC transporter ATP-binding protein, partial [Dongiaceae bacterium]|nr:ABC transporter ATP-binding protein [Dongiaceae bacterium]